MKRNSKKGFTIVELIIVIAVIAVLAAVLIPAFSSIIQKAKDSAYLQDRTNKQTEGTIEKIDNPNYMTWEDFEDKLAEALTKANDSTAEKIQAAVGEAIKNARFDEPGITESQIRDIIERTLEGQLTDAQVKAIVEKAVEGKGVSAEDVNKIVNKAISNLPKKVGVTKDKMTEAIKSAVQNIATGLSASEVESAINSALAKFDNDGITDNQIADIVSKVLAQLDLNKLSNEKVQQAIDAVSVSRITDADVIASYDFVKADDTQSTTKADTLFVFNVAGNGGAPTFDESNGEYWFADYEVTFIHDSIEEIRMYMEDGTNTVPIYLCGSYGPYYVALPVWYPNVDGTYEPLKVGKPIKLLGQAMNMAMTYNEVKDQVGEFICGIKNNDSEYDNMIISVKLCLYNCVQIEVEDVEAAMAQGAFRNGSYWYQQVGDKIECASITYTLNDHD